MGKTNDEVIMNSLNVSNGEDVLFFLGAGCSINSGCMPSSKLIFEFKKRIYCAKHGIQLDSRTLVDEIKLKESVEEEFAEVCVENEYSFYFEKCFPDVFDRGQFVKNEFQDKKPSFGYLCFADYLISRHVRCVLTTNFDLLIERAVKKLDESYDLVNVSEDIIPRLSSSLEVVKLHGDYNYNKIKNTVDELNSLNEELENRLLRINAKKIIVIGYSGKDKSVMTFLKRFLEQNRQTSLLWCDVKEECDNKDINNLIKINENSKYICITGFDSLFDNYCKVFGYSNELLKDVKAKVESNQHFDLLCSNQPEYFKTNAYKAISQSLIYKTEQEMPEPLLEKLYFYDKVSDNTFFICDESTLSDVSNFGIDFSVCDVFSKQINLVKKCKYTKELIKFTCLQRGIGIYRDNLYFDKGDEIKTGLKVSVDLFNENICLHIFPNYFIVSENITENQKYVINKRKSSLYTKQNWALLNELSHGIFGEQFSFSYGEIGVVFSNEPKTSDELAAVYECIKEPFMVGNAMQSVNQLKILDSVGPKKTIYSPEEIKVGVFCLEEDKAKLKSFLDLVKNGDTGVGTGIIPKYRGFYNVFKKKITFIYDALPAFYLRMFRNKTKDQIVGDFMRGISKMYKEKQIDIALIYIGSNFSWIRTEGDFDFHDKIKLLSANKFKTQFLEEKTIDSADNKSKILFNLATGIYTKTIGMPWYPLNHSNDTLFLGISFGRDSKGITVGCSQMFDGAGRGMQLIISQISEKKCRKNQYLSQDEAFELGKKIRYTYYRSSKIDELKRIIIHRSDPFRKEEVAGFAKAFAGINDFALIEIIEESALNVYPFKNGFCCGFPIKRGTVLKASSDTAYIWTDGSVVDADIDGGRTYRNSKRGMGKPLKIKKYFGNISLNDIAYDLMYLTKMDFNSSDVLYSKLPVTIKYSRMVCEIIKQGNFDDESISFEYVM